ncbi:hypothetical protein B1R38_00275 [Bacillus cereus]|uniref:prephenate dehydrogenase dimerization domain-containing protein n=1 Tax=Bacillus cereus group TaxID=86661 RepID=UPI000D65C7DD|nr:prephenate dehydrogenase dimerization domain-containing protein [Bacillus cereus]PWE75160.1 hypothetical protein B1R38_00275 [Bacillus cereus]HDX9646672.1 prephenate dehydrogenase [Bacillus cereus]
MENEKIIILGGNGLIGRFISELLMKSGKNLVILDKDKFECNFLRTECEKYYSNLEIIVSDVLSDDINYLFSSGDAIVFALPEAACLEVMSSKSHLIKEEVKIINTCSIQSSFFKHAKTFLPNNPLVGINFMFSPTLPYKGRGVAIVKEENSEVYTMVKNLIEDNDMVAFEFDPHSHDEKVSLVQALPHILTLSLISVLSGKHNFSIEELIQLSPPPMQMMLCLSARLTENSPDVYWDIQKHNPYAENIRADVIDSICNLIRIIEGDYFTDFSILLKNHEDVLGGSLNELKVKCNQYFNIL